MSFIIVVLCLALLIVLISYFKVDAFIAFLISSILAGIALGIPLEKLPDSVNNGIGSILGGLTLIIVLGAMLGKLVAESGAAQKIASVMVSLFGTKHIQGRFFRNILRLLLWIHLFQEGHSSCLLLMEGGSV